MSSSGTPTTVVEPTTTSEPPLVSTSLAVDLRAAAQEGIELAFEEQFAVWRDCTADYDECDPAVAFADVYTGRAFDNLTDAVLSKQGTGRKNTPLAPDTDFQRVDGIEFTNEELTEATVSYCAVDSRLVSVAGEDGTGVIIDDAVFHDQGFAFYAKEANGRWLLESFDIVLSSDQEPICDG